MTSRVIDLTSRKDIAKDLQVTDYVLQLTDKEQREEFENRLIDDKNLQHQVNEEIKLRSLIRNAYPAEQIPESAFNQFSQALEAESQQEVDNSFFRRYSGLVSIAATVIVTILVFAFMPTSQVDEFETLSNDEMQLIDNPDGLFYTIIFAKGVTQQKQLSLAKSLGFVIASNGGIAGSVVIKVDNKLTADELAQWRETPQIAFLESAVSVRK